MKKLKWFVLLCVFIIMNMPETQSFAASEIQIDGYYDDWERIPKTKISYGSHNSREMHEAAVVMGEEYLYAYVRLSELYQTQIPVSEYRLTVNGKTVVLSILGKDDAGNVNWGVNPYQLSVGIYKDEFGMFHRDNIKQSLGEVAVTITNDLPNDALEFRMRLDVLEELYGFPAGTIKNGANISFCNPNLGTQSVELLGTSSGALAGVTLCMASVGLAFVFRKKRKMIAK